MGCQPSTIYIVERSLTITREELTPLRTSKDGEISSQRSYLMAAVGTTSIVVGKGKNAREILDTLKDEHQTTVKNIETDLEVLKNICKNQESRNEKHPSI